ncbi:MAG TPA: hypothetical protein PKK10_14240, partial [Woeseiaceae bacterium]|nr:hypothetical protein [Woeseiaceae bacterium]
DTALSRRQQGFESPWGRHTKKKTRLARVFFLVRRKALRGKPGFDKTRQRFGRTKCARRVKTAQRLF